MQESPRSIPWFKLVFTVLGAVYMLLALSMLVRGVDALRPFAVPESTIADPVLQDFFFFFYQLMAYIGVLTVLLGHVARELKTQRLVASVFCLANLLITLRDLTTSDSRFGNRLYKGEDTMVFVYIGLIYTAAYGLLAVRGWMTSERPHM